MNCETCIGRRIEVESRIHALQWLRRLAVPLLAGGLSISLTACTTIPAKEFGGYRDALAKARGAAEEILTDYAAARVEFQELKKKRAKPTKPGRPAPLSDSIDSFDNANLDHIAIRIQAWDVIAKYNEALARLAEGRSAGEVATAVDGLISSLSQSPLADLTQFASQITPFLGPLKVLLTEAESEAARQRFHAGLRAGLPLIKQQFITLLWEDTRIMFDVRSGLNNAEYDPLMDKISDAKRNFDELARTFQLNDEIRKHRSDIGRALDTLPREPDGSDPVAPPDAATGTESMGAAAKVQLESLKAGVLRQVDAVLQKNKALFAYRDTLVAYRALLLQMRNSINALEIAAENARSAPAMPSDGVLKAVIELRRTYRTYTDAK